MSTPTTQNTRPGGRRLFAAALLVLGVTASGCIETDMGLFDDLAVGDCVREKSPGGITIDGQLERIDCSDYSNGADDTYRIGIVDSDPQYVMFNCPALLRGIAVNGGDRSICFEY